MDGGFFNNCSIPGLNDPLGFLLNKPVYIIIHRTILIMVGKGCILKTGLFYQTQCWSEQSACDQRSILGRPLFLVIGPSVLRAPAKQTKVVTILGTFFHFSCCCCYHLYSKPQKGFSYCFKFVHGLLTNINKNLGKNKLNPPPGPLGRFLVFFRKF